MQDSKRYLLEFIGAMTLYAIAVIAMDPIITALGEGSSWLWAAAMIPVIPTALVVWAIARSYFRQDEMQRRVIAETHFFAAMITIFLTFAYGFLEIYVGVPKLPTILILPGFFLCMGICTPFVIRRYR